jgi:hypothetical protein
VIAYAPIPPNLVTAPDERNRCCVLDDDGNRCPQRSRFWVGGQVWDDYTHVCGDHVEAVKRPGDSVVRL